MCSGVLTISGYWFKKSVTCSSGASDGIFRKLMLRSFFFWGKFLEGRKLIFHPLTSSGSVQKASIISLLLKVIERKFCCRKLVLFLLNKVRLCKLTLQQNDYGLGISLSPDVRFVVVLLCWWLLCVWFLLGFSTIHKGY